MNDIIDNRDSDLADAFRPLLNESVRAHFAVSYFFLSGFNAIAEALEKVQVRYACRSATRRITKRSNSWPKAALHARPSSHRQANLTRLP